MLDLDNTIADREAAVGAWLREFSQQHNVDPTGQAWILELDNDGYSDRTEVFSAIKDRLGLQPPVERLLADYQRRVVELTTPTSGAIDCLTEMRRRGWTLALVTNGSSGQQHGKIDALGIRNLFDTICVSGDLGIKKPAAEIFKIAAEQVDVTTAGAWMVGDSPVNDVDAPRRLGMNTAWVTRGRSWPGELPPPTVSVDGLGDLVGVIADSTS